MCPLWTFLLYLPFYCFSIHIVLIVYNVLLFHIVIEVRPLEWNSKVSRIPGTDLQVDGTRKQMAASETVMTTRVVL